MKTYMVGYDLNRPRKASDYPNLIKALKEDFSSWWHHLDSTWLIKTNQTAAQIRERLTPFIDNGDELLVVRVMGEGAWKGFNTDGSKWLKDNLTTD